MGNTSTFRGRLRSKGGRSAATPTVGLQAVMFAFDAAITTPTLVRVGTSATTGEYLTLPKGTNILRATRLIGTTGGTNPSYNIGISGTESHFYLNFDGDSTTPADYIGVVPTGTGHITDRVTTKGTATDHLVYATDGTGTAGTGTVVFYLEYFVYDDGKVESAV